MKYHYTLILLLLLASCKSPSELLEKGSYDRAFTEAMKEIKKGKDVKINSEVALKASQQIAHKSLLEFRKKSNSHDVENWIDGQSNLFEVLERIGEANLELDGLLNAPYDKLCTEKKSIDYKIVEHYYNEGHDYFDAFDRNGQKIEARNAYYSFKKCDKYEGQTYFPNLALDIDAAYQNGIVYYTSNSINSSQLFLKPLPVDADFGADCNISISHGFVSYTTSESIHNDKKTKNIKTGQETIVDTSGVTTFRPIYEDVEATIVTKTITVEAEVQTNIWSEDLTGNCTVETRNIITTLDDSYDEVSVLGDERALYHIVTKTSGEPAFLRSSLESDLMKKANNAIGL